MKPRVSSKTVSILIVILSFNLLGLFTTSTSAHPVHVRQHLAARERVPFWNDPDWGTKAPETPQPMATNIPIRPLPSPFLPVTTPGVAAPRPTTTPGIAVVTPMRNNAPLISVTSEATPTPTPGFAPPKPVASNPLVPGAAPKPEKSCLDLSLWATASGPSPMMSVAGSLSKNKQPICSIWALVDQASPKTIELTCMKGHEASFRFDNGIGQYKGDGRTVRFNVVRREEAKVDGKEAWSWRTTGCWDE